MFPLGTEREGKEGGRKKKRKRKERDRERKCVCVCVCVCVWERDRDRERQRERDRDGERQRQTERAREKETTDAWLRGWVGASIIYRVSSVYLSVSLSVSLSLCLSVCFSLSLFLSLSLSLSLSLCSFSFFMFSPALPFLCPQITFFGTNTSIPCLKIRQRCPIKSNLWHQNSGNNLWIKIH